MKTKQAASHTPAPWTSRECANHVEGTADYVIVWRDGTQENHRNRRLDSRQGGRFSKQDANLIAAAPDLLAALEILLSTTGDKEIEEHDLDGHEAGSCAICISRAAINKALGIKPNEP